MCVFNPAHNMHTKNMSLSLCIKCIYVDLHIYVEKCNMFDGWAKPGNITTPLCVGEPEPPLSRQKSFRHRFYHRENGGGPLGMVPLIINPIYTYTPYIVGIYWVYPFLKGLQPWG